MTTRRCAMCMAAAALTLILNLALWSSLLTEAEIEIVTHPAHSVLRNTCLPRAGFGTAVLYMGPDVNDSSNRQIYDEAKKITLKVLYRSLNEAFTVEKLSSGRFSYPKPSGFGDWQVRISWTNRALKRSGWYLPPTDALEVCSLNISGEVVFFRGFAFGSFQYGHVLHDLLPVLVWMSASYPSAQVVLELDKQGKIEPFLAWFDPSLHRRAIFVQPDVVVCAGVLLAVVPQRGIQTPHGLRIPALFNHLRSHVLYVQPSHNPVAAVHEVRIPATAGHGRLLTQDHSRQVLQIASSAIQQHSMPLEIVEFNGTSNGKAATFHDQYRLFNSAVLVFGPHGTGFSNILWMPCHVPVAAIEFVCGAHSLHVRGCQLNNGKVRLATYWSLEGSVSWVKYFHVLARDASTEMSDFMQVDLEGFSAALDAALRYIARPTG
ncbi:CA14 [Symbiodinium sp. CCMP2592]|nr:CA14 [Symbiodinium sp. CCMP2592]